MRTAGALLLVTLVAAPGGSLVSIEQAQEQTPAVWAKPDHFWFRKSVTGGHVWLTVDAVHGVKEPLFDHQRLAIELGVRGAGEFTPLGLPFSDAAAEFVVKYDGSNAYIQEGALAIEFILNEWFWRCDLQIKWNWNLVPPTDYECLPRRQVTPGPPRTAAPAVPVPSPDGRWVAMIRDHNVAMRPTSGGDWTALSTDGSASTAYQHGSLVWSKDSRSLTAYRVQADVWLAPSLSANVKSLIQRGSWAIAR